MAATIGQPAPDFALIDQNKHRTTLEDFKGRKTLVVFIPFPFTGVCDAEGCAIRDGLGELEELDANVVVITAHSFATNAKWAEVNGFTFPILADYWPHGEVSRAYGTFNEDVGVATRSSYVLDADGIVRDIVATAELGVAREHEAQVRALASI
jgi:peroxiredoxin